MTPAAAPPTPFYIQGAGDPIFAIYHAPAGGEPTAGVLMCPPFGWEDMCSYRSRRVWAQQLADLGFGVLRIDFPGSGDSGGSARDPDLVQAWTDAVTTSARWLAADRGCARIVAVGIGIGGLIAYRAAALGAPVDDLVLWATSARGRTHTRELRAFAGMEGGGPVGDLHAGAGDATARGVDMAAGGVDMPEGSLAAAGYLLSAQTLADLEAIDTTELALPQAASRRVLLVGRDGRSVDERLKLALEQSGSQVDVAPGRGYERMVMLEPQDSVPAQSVFDDVASWLAQGSQAADASSVRRPGEGPAQTPSAVFSEGDGNSWRETPFGLTHPLGDPFGVLVEPLERAADFCIVWLNAGPQRRTGPNRMWVEASRRWAARGVASVRMDMAAIGDAEGDPAPLADSRSFYVPEYVAQVRDVLDALQARGVSDRFVLAGLCAGGYWALQATLGDRRVAAAVLLNPGALVYDGGLSLAVRETRTLAQKALRLSTWRRVVEGKTTVSAHFRTARVLAAGGRRKAAELPSRLKRRRAGSSDDELDRDLDRLDREDRPLTMVFAGEEPLYARLVRDGLPDRLERWPRISLTHIELPADVHTLRPLWVQQRVHALLDAAVGEQAARWRPDPVPAA